MPDGLTAIATIPRLPVPVPLRIRPYVHQDFQTLYSRLRPTGRLSATCSWLVGGILDVDIITAEYPITDAKPYRIVIVDDDEAVRDSLAILLSLSGFDAHSFETGVELQNAIADQQIDCLIIDVNMPVMNGLELVNWLNDSAYEIPVILISANFDCSTERHARQAGVSQFLEKPFSDESMITAIRGLLN